MNLWSSPSRRTGLTVLVGAAILLGTGACTTTMVSGNGAAAVAPQLTVERFLQAANDRDLDSMSRLFGTSEGPIGDTGSTFVCFWKKIGSIFGGTSCMDRSEVEIRLDAIARVLRHLDYRMGAQEPVAGRSTPTRRIFVHMTLDGNIPVDRVPFVVVQGGEQRWYVEEIGLERILSAGGV